MNLNEFVDVILRGNFTSNLYNYLTSKHRSKKLNSIKEEETNINFELRRSLGSKVHYLDFLGNFHCLRTLDVS